MVLCKNDLHALLVALDLSRQTMTRIHANYFWALAYNACLIPVAAGVLYPAYHFALAPMLAGAAMALSSGSIVLSSLLLMRYQPPRSFEAPSMHASGEAAEGECNCPASSAQELDVEEASPFAQAWTALLGGGNESSAVAMEGLLTPAEWRASVVEGNHDDSRSMGGEHMEPTGDGKAVWNPLTVVSGGGGKQLLRGRGDGGKYALVGSAEDTGDVEEGTGSLAGAKDAHKTTDVGSVRTGKKIRANIAEKTGCGCGQGNCRCGADCRCGQPIRRDARR
jgi:hypothetical protein